MIPALLALAAPPALPAPVQNYVDPAVNVPISTKASTETNPLVAFTPVGNTWVSWMDGFETGQDLRLQLLGAPCCPSFPSDGILVADRDFSGADFVYGLDVAPNGDAVLAYRDFAGGSFQIAVSRVDVRGDVVWTSVVATGSSDLRSPLIAALDDGSFTVAWGEAPAVRAMRIDGAGSPVWGAPLTLAPAVGAYELSDLEATTGTDSIVALVQSDGPFSVSRHLLAQRIDGLGGTPWGASPVTVFDGGSLDVFVRPELAQDGSGGAVLTYSSAAPAIECFVQRLDASGAELFPHNGVAVATSSSAERTDPHAIFSAASGQVVVAWQDQSSSGTPSTGISLQRVDAAGNLLLGPAGATVVPLTPSFTNSPRVLGYDSSSSIALVVWEDEPFSEADRIFRAEIDAAGALLGSVEDVASTPSGKTWTTSPQGAESGGLLVWSDRRSDGGDIYGQPVDFSFISAQTPVSQFLCSSNPNSTGATADAFAIGSLDVDDNALWFYAQNLPPNQFGIFVVSLETGPPIPVNDGLLCLSGNIGRFSLPNQILGSGADGTFCLRADLRAFPQLGTILPVDPADTWHAQAWYRDRTPAPTSNFTSGFSVTLQ